MLMHCVTVTFTASTTDEQIESFRKGAEHLAQTITLAKSYRHGRDLGQRQGNAHYAIVAEFESVEDFKAYLKHPAHVAFATEQLIPLADTWQTVQVEI